MGVVRDVTVDNLVTAVGNIDTSSLAQDSTLQNVVTAIGNISGGSDPVTNTTVNSLCKDTTGQSIASAISGLGQTLGSDKANIDGSNIANPSAFRQAIHVPAYNFANQDRPKMTLIIAQVSVSISGGTGTVDLSSYLPSGMSFSSIALATAKSTTSFAVTGATIDTTTNILTIKVSNTSSSATTDFNILAFAF